MVRSFLRDVLGEEENSNDNFDMGAFISLFGANSWDYSRNTPCVNYVQTTNNFRINMPDNSFAYNDASLLSSVKIDAVTHNAKDDHLSLQAIYNTDGTLFCVMGTVDIYQNHYPDNYQAPATGIIFKDTDGQIKQLIKNDSDDLVITVLDQYTTIKSAYQGILTAQINNLDELYGIDTTQQQLDLVTVSNLAIDGIEAAIQ